MNFLLVLPRRFALQTVLLVQALALALPVYADGNPRFEIIASFERSPEHPLRAGAASTSIDGPFSTASEGGDYNCGAILRLATGTSPAPVLHFSGKTGDTKGNAPSGALLTVSNAIWGTTQRGGANDGGTVYRWDPANNLFTTVIEFGTRDQGDANYLGLTPKAGLVQDGHGILWGTTSSPSTIYKLNPTSRSSIAVVIADGPPGTTIGNDLRGELVFDGVDSLWGVSSDGGSQGHGLVFKIHQDTGVLTVVQNFTGAQGTTIGTKPTGTLLNDGNGYLWGLTSPIGDPTNAGHVFKISVNTGDLTHVADLPTTNEGSFCTEGLVLIGTNRLAGFIQSAHTGVNPTYGAIFTLSTVSGQAAVSATLNNSSTQASGTIMLSRLSSGEVIGMASEGGTYDKGTTFRVLGAGTITGFAPLAATSAGELDSGYLPSGGLMQTVDGALQGCLLSGGFRGAGAIYRFVPSDDALQQVSVSPSHGLAHPVGELVTSKAGVCAGSVWGLSKAGGLGNTFRDTDCGALFSLPDYTVGHLESPDRQASLDTTQAAPTTGLCIGPDDRLWAASGESIYAYDPLTRSFRRPITFTGIAGAAPGSEPSSALMFDGGRYMWGCTRHGGANDCGTVYRVDMASHEFTNVVEFAGTNSYPRGREPNGTLLRDSFGRFWGVTKFGGRYDQGTVFFVDGFSGAVTTVTDFDSASRSWKGAQPSAGLVADGRGWLWGTTSKGGASDFGTIFRIHPITRIFESMFTFTGPLAGVPGSSPEAQLFLHSDGNLYGTTTGAGLDAAGHLRSGGSIFRIRFGRRIVTAATADGHIEDGVPLDLGVAYDVDSQRTRTITVKNVLGFPISPFNATLSGPDGSDFKITNAQLGSLPPNGIQTLQITFDPSAVGQRNATLTIGGDLPDADAFVVPLTGQGVQRTVSIDQSYDGRESAGTQPITVRISAPLRTAARVPLITTAGTASAADFKVDASNVTIPAGQTTATFTVTIKQDYLIEDNESFTIALGKPSSPNVVTGPDVTGHGSSSLAFTIFDDDYLPDIPGPGDCILQPGEIAIIDSGYQASNIPSTSSWRRNGKVIPGASKGELTLGNTNATNAGTYQFSVKTVTGITVDGPLSEIAVIDQQPQRVSVAANSTARLGFIAAGNELTFSWSRLAPMTSTEIPLADDAKYAQSSTNTLQITGVDASDNGIYLCFVTFRGNALPGPIEFRLSVHSIAPQSFTPVFPTAMVQVPFEYQLPFPGDDAAAPSTVTVSGLPSGLKCHPSTGRITGTPVTAGTFNLRMTMTNSKGSLVVSAPLTVLTLPKELVGRFVGNLGGVYVDFLVTPLGTATGTVRDVGKLYSFTSVLKPDGAELTDAQMNAIIPALNGPTDPALSIVTGPSFGSPNYFSGAIQPYGTFGYGWRNVWSPSNPPPAPAQGYYTFSVREYGAAPTAPGYLGNSPGSLTIPSSGTTTVSARLADGTALAHASCLGPELEFVIYQGLYAYPGHFIAEGKIFSDSSSSRATINATGSWYRPPSTSPTRFFQDGFWPGIELTGSRYVRPPAGQLAVNFDAPPNNAMFTFGTSDFSVLNSPPDVEFSLSTTHRATLPALGSDANPGRVTNVIIDPITGNFSGKFTLDSGTTFARTATFAGVMDQSTDAGYGYFLIATPADNQAVPPTTLSNSPMVSGWVRLASPGLAP